ncbi:MAG: FKBP-type peptidyl-prolyl cis-trans isomerase [Candidatus Korobacteraceae bacterium]|jgi:FKBP-type peptidyl-prolyl cis-trans isomerase FklB
MLKLLTSAVTVLAAGVILLGSAMAQQSANPQSQPANNASAAQTQQAPATSAGDAALPTQKDKVSYAVGMNIGHGLHRDGIDIDPNVLLRGLKDAMAGGATLMTDEQASAMITELQNQLRQKAEAQRQQAGASNKKDGEAFLAANKAKPGVVTLPSGLQYKILKEGTGAKPTAADSVKCNYRGTLINGTEFDASEKHGGPATFPVKGVIKGWTEALQLMPVGSKWELVLPPDLAYGARGAGDVIGPDETLVFEVELLSIQPKEQSQTPK